LTSSENLNLSEGNLVLGISQLPTYVEQVENGKIYMVSKSSV